MKPIIFDVDGVLLDWEHGFQRWALDRGVKFTSPRPTSWDLCEWTGLDSDTVFTYIQEFNRSPQFAELYEYTDAAVFVRGVVSKGHVLYTISCYNSGEPSVYNRVQNLRRKFGRVFDAIFSLPLRKTKSHVLQNLYDREGPCYWIEDNHSNAYVGREAGHTCFVLRRPHNRDDEAKYGNLKGLTWVDNFHQIKEAIENEY